MPVQTKKERLPAVGRLELIAVDLNLAPKKYDPNNVLRLNHIEPNCTPNT